MSDIPLLQKPVSDKATIEANFLDVTVSEGVFRTGRFKMALPKLWHVKTSGEAEIPSKNTPVVQLAVASPGTTDALGAEIDATVVVWAVLLPRVMNGSDWLRRWSVTQGYEIAAIRELPTPNGVMGDAVMISKKTGRLHRMVTMKDADVIYLVDGSVDPKGAPEDPALQEIALMAVIRFKLLESSGVFYAEPMQEQVLKGDMAQAALLLPQSWEQQPDGPAIGDSVERVFMHRIGDLVTGTMLVTLQDDQQGFEKDAAALEEGHVARLATQGIQMGEATMLLEGKRKASSFSAWLRRGTAANGQAMTLLCMRAQASDIPMSLVVLSAAADTEFESWAVNRRVFEIVLETHALVAG